MPKMPDPVKPGFSPVEVKPHIDKTFAPIEVTPYGMAAPVTPPSAPAAGPAQSADAAEKKEN